MKDAFKSLVLILLALAIATAFAWIYFRNKGLAQPIHPLQHPFFEAHKAPTLVALSGGSGERPENTFEAFDHALSVSKDIVLWADVQVTKDGTMILFREKDVSRTTGAVGWINYMTDAEVAKLDPGFALADKNGERPWQGKGLRVPTLQEFLARYPDARVVLNFMEYAPGLDERIVSLAERFRARERILFHSEIDGLTKDLRDKQAMWLFGTSRAQITRFLMLNSIGLAAAASLRGDVFITPSRAGKAPLLEESARLELQRRKTPVLAGPVRDAGEAKELLAQGVAGILTAHPSELSLAL